jgi:hypothetical protein
MAGAFLLRRKKKEEGRRKKEEGRRPFDTSTTLSAPLRSGTGKVQQ